VLQFSADLYSVHTARLLWYTTVFVYCLAHAIIYEYRTCFDASLKNAQPPRSFMHRHSPTSCPEIYKQLKWNTRRYSEASKRWWYS